MPKHTLLIFILLISSKIYSQNKDSLEYYSNILHNSLSICNGEAVIAFKYFKSYVENNEIENHVDFFNKYMNSTLSKKKEFRRNVFSYVINCEDYSDTSYPNCKMGSIYFYNGKITSIDFGPFN